MQKRVQKLTLYNLFSIWPCERPVYVKLSSMLRVFLSIILTGHFAFADISEEEMERIEAAFGPMTVLGIDSSEPAQWEIDQHVATSVERITGINLFRMQREEELESLHVILNEVTIRQANAVMTVLSSARIMRHLQSSESLKLKLGFADLKLSFLDEHRRISEDVLEKDIRIKFTDQYGTYDVFLGDKEVMGELMHGYHISFKSAIGPDSWNHTAEIQQRTWALVQELRTRKDLAVQELSALNIRATESSQTVLEAESRCDEFFLSGRKTIVSKN